jgi:hypothetical protein
LSASATKLIQVQKQATTVTLPSAIHTLVYGTTLASLISGTTASVAGLLNFYINDASGQHITETTVLTTGTYTIYSLFTPSDTTNYLSSSSTASLTIEKQITTISLSSLSSITYGETLTAFISGSTASVDGSLKFYLNDASGELLTTSTILPASTSYTIYTAFVPTDGSNYLSTFTTKLFTVEKQSTSITLPSITSIVYGSTLASFVTGTTASVDGSLNFFLNDASGELVTSATVLNASSSNYTIFCAFTPADTTNYLSSSSTKSLTVQKQTTTITLPPLTSIVYGATLSGLISGTTASVDGSFNFYLNNDSGQLLTSATVLNAFSYTIYCAFTPSDTTNYLSSFTTKSLTVQKQSTTITLSSLSNIVYGTTFATFISGTTASVDGSFLLSLNDASGQLLTSETVLNASLSSYTIYYSFVPTDTANYLSSSSTKSLTVQKQTTTVTLSSLGSIIYGSTLSTFIAGSSASVDGSLNFYINNVNGQRLTESTILNVASYTIYCEFQPTDSTNYQSSSQSTLLEVQKQTTSVVCGIGNVSPFFVA